jgi:hypothetical protein
MALLAVFFSVADCLPKTMPLPLSPSHDSVLSAPAVGAAPALSDLAILPPPLLLLGEPLPRAPWLKIFV